MREIVFRGMSRGDEWVGGSLVRSGDAFLIVTGGEPVEVIPESVGEWSGFADKNGVPIYEGDLVRADTPWTPTTLPFSWGVMQLRFGKDALAYIQQLEAIVSEKEKVVAELSGKIGQLEAKRKQLLEKIELLEETSEE